VSSSFHYSLASPIDLVAPSDWSLHLMRPVQKAYIRPPIASIPLCPENSPLSRLLERRPIPAKLPRLPDPSRPVGERTLKIHEEPDVALTTSDFAEVLRYLYDRPQGSRPFTAGDVKILSDEYPALFSYVFEITKIAKLRHLLNSRSVGGDAREKAEFQAAAAAAAAGSPKRTPHAHVVAPVKSQAPRNGQSSASSAAASSSAISAESPPHMTRRATQRLKQVAGPADVSGEESDTEVDDGTKAADGNLDCPICSQTFRRLRNFKSEWSSLCPFFPLDLHAGSSHGNS
jgi:hypothetical protein